MNVIEEHTRTIGGYSTYFLAAGSGRPLVLVHGVGGSSLTFRWNLEELSEYFRVYALDLPGHGKSEKPDIRYAAEDSVPFLITFLEEVAGGPAALVGVSAGGLMCGLLAAERPDLVTHLVMVSSAGLGRDIDWGLRLLSLPVARPWLENARGEPNVIRMSMRRIVHDPSVITDDVVAALVEERNQPGHGRVNHTAIRSNISLFGVRRWRQHFRKIRRVGAPVMIIWGKQDKLIPVRHAYRAAKRLAGAPIHIIDRCGHWPPFEHPREFNRLVLEFVRF